MNEIYPDKESRRALEVFCITRGNGEYFDLSTKPITRSSFVIGENKESVGETVRGYYITDACIGCQKCIEVCPQKCIDTEDIPFKIRQENCLHCGNCKEACPSKAVGYQADECFSLN